LGIRFNKSGISSKEQSIELASRMIRTIPIMKMIGFNFGFYRPPTNVAIYKTFIRSRGEYGLAILPRPNIKLLQRCQNKAINAALSTSKSSAQCATHLLTRICKMDVRNFILKAKLLLRWIDMEDTQPILVQITNKTASRIFGSKSLLGSIQNFPLYQWMFYANNGDLKERDRSLDDEWTLRFHQFNNQLLSSELQQKWSNSLSIINPTRNVCPMLRLNYQSINPRTLIQLVCKNIPGKPTLCLKCSAVFINPTHVFSCSLQVQPLQAFIPQELRPSPTLWPTYMISRYLNLFENPLKEIMAKEIIKVIHRCFFECLQWKLR